MNTPAPVSPPSSPTAPTASAADAAPPASVDPADIDALRAFNRFYTQRIGVLNPYLDSAFSLTEVRVLYELAHHGPCTGVTLARALNLDAGYLSRLLRRFTAKQWIAKQASAADARVQDISLTAEGRRAFEPLVGSGYSLRNVVVQPANRLASAAVAASDARIRFISSTWSMNRPSLLAHQLV